ncbi:MFS transporter [Devosia sp. XJ19-1]|uniref:MFS transporter n=1 Tax=Devosia ureilytica TaxID=2952754 RepID=A0A9Q4AKU7_9HYPH|nr:MFS transporter [Devosia ureilytica]MCP8882336.1 MFS transporter [Devosia ureilytica]MCP8885777.1 MFS transporter [Devosia ureilytica]
MSVMVGLGNPEQSNTDAVERGTVAQRMDRLPLTWLHLGIVGMAALGFAFDLMEVALGNVLSAVFSTAPYSVEPIQLSWLLSAMYIGAIPGALLSGWLADRFGRRGVLISILLVLSATSMAAAASPDINSLIFWRVLSGLALGAYPPLMMAFLADLMPPGKRGMLITMTAGIAGLGPVAMIFLVRALTESQPFGIEAWRWAFVLGGAGSLLTAIGYGLLPESPRWLSARGRTLEANRAVARFERSTHVIADSPTNRPVSREPSQSSFHLGGSRPQLKRFGLVAAIYFLTPWATVAFPLLMGAVLIEKGFALSDSLLYVGVSMFGPAVGTIIGAFFVDRFERRFALIGFALGMIAATAVFAASFDPIWLVASGVAVQLLAMLYLPTMTTYAAELFPTSWRARTSTAAWSVNRVASALAPLVLLPLMKTHGVWPMFAVMIASLIIGILLVAVAPNGRAGQAVE